MNEPSVRENCPQDSLVGQVADEFLRRQEQGERPDIEEYANKYPEAADLMRKVLLSLKVLEHSGVGVAAGAAAESEDPPPRELGDFQILREIGRGGMGIVYEAEQISLGRRVALKILPFAATMDKRHLQRFLNEARAAAWLRHPHIVPVYAVGCTRGVNYYAMQLIEGQTLESLYQVLREEPKTPTPANVEATAVLPLAGRNGVPKQPSKGGDTFPGLRGQGSTLKSAKDSRKHCRRLAELAIQAADALEHAHQSGVIHRDIKPANLLLDEEGDLWVTDFGLAQVDRDSRLTMTGDLLGTLRYMSPEQALAKRVIVDQRTDIYSLGATFYEMLTLKPVFAGKDRQELLRQIAFEEPAPPRRLDKHIPIELETVILKCLEKNPQDRYGTAKELADDLKRFLNDEPTLARRPSVLQRGRKWGRRHVAGMRATAAALFVIVAIAAVMAGWWLRDHAARQSETERVVSAALDETIEWQRQRKMPEALNAAKRAKAILASGSSTPALQERVHKRLADLTAVTELEAIRVQQGFEVQKLAWYVGHSFAQTEKKYAEVFLTLGIDVDAQSTDTVASLIRERSVAVELAAALDELSYVDVKVWPHMETKRKRLLAIARAADPEPLRNRLRWALEEKDIQKLKDIAGSKEVQNLPPVTLIILAKSLGRKGENWQVTLQLLKDAQQHHKTDFWINEQLASCFDYGESPNLDEAIRFYTAALAIRPDAAIAHSLLGLALRDKGRLDEAIAAHRQAVQLVPDFAGFHSNLGNALGDKGLFDEAIAAYGEAIRLNPSFAQPHNNLGNLLEKRGRLDDAIAAFREAIRLKPDYPKAHRNLGIVFDKKGQHDDAIAAFREAIRLKPDDPESHFTLGVYFASKKQYEGAIAAYREAIRLKPNYSKAHYNLAIALNTQGHVNEAIASYQEALRHSPKYPAARTNLSGLLMQTGRLDEAITVVLEGTRAAGNTAQAHMTAASQLENIHATAEAIREWQAAIRLERMNAMARNALAWCLATAKEVKDRNVAEALVHAKIAVELAPKNPAILNTLGVAHFRNGDWKVAIEVLNEAIEVQGEGHCVDYFPLAMAHWHVGDKVQARACYDKGVQRMETVSKERADVIVQRFRAEAAELLGIAAPNQDGKDSSAPKK